MRSFSYRNSRGLLSYNMAQFIFRAPAGRRASILLDYDMCESHIVY